MNGLLSIVTPTYNREDTLKILFESLKKQTNYNFEWIVIDDGSTDNTEVLLKSILVQQLPFKISYHKQKNGGKHRALNASHSYISGEIVLILDSDDYLTEDAVETTLSEWSNYRSNSHICGMSFMKGKKDGTFLSKKNKNDEPYIDDEITYRVNGNVHGDRCEILRTDLFKNHKFPEYDGENFMSEGWLWTNLAKEKYKMVYFNKVIYICEYLPNGLTLSGRKLRIKSPRGMLENCKVYICKQVKFSRRLKATILYATYAQGVDLKFRVYMRETMLVFPFNLFVYPIGKVLFFLWSNN